MTSARLQSNNIEDIQNYVQDEISAPVRLPRFTAAELVQVPAARYPYRLVAVTDGAGNRWAAMSNGTTWRYLDGTSV
jgi:hypothetical protein